MIIDLHNHTSQLSACSIIEIDTLIKIYINAKIDGICITEHNKILPQLEQKKIKEKYKDKIKIFFGIEINTDLGHILTFSSDFRQFERLNLESEILYFSNIVEKVDKNKVSFIWAHPLRWTKFYNKDKYLTEDIIKNFDAIELFNGNLPIEVIKLTKEKFDRFNVKYTGGSDTHSINMALKYATKFNLFINDEKELIMALKNNKYYPVIINI